MIPDEDLIQLLCPICKFLPEPEPPVSLGCCARITCQKCAEDGIRANSKRCVIDSQCNTYCQISDLVPNRARQNQVEKLIKDHPGIQAYVQKLRLNLVKKEKLSDQGQQVVPNEEAKEPLPDHVLSGETIKAVAKLYSQLQQPPNYVEQYFGIKTMPPSVQNLPQSSASVRPPTPEPPTPTPSAIKTEIQCKDDQKEVPEAKLQPQLQKRCALCRKHDHETRNCPKIEDTICKRCGTIGHVALQCKEAPTASFSFTSLPRTAPRAKIERIDGDDPDQDDVEIVAIADSSKPKTCEVLSIPSSPCSNNSDTDTDGSSDSLLQLKSKMAQFLEDYERRKAKKKAKKKKAMDRGKKTSIKREVSDDQSDSNDCLTSGSSQRKKDDNDEEPTSNHTSSSENRRQGSSSRSKSSDASTRGLRKKGSNGHQSGSRSKSPTNALGTKDSRSEIQTKNAKCQPKSSKTVRRTQNRQSQERSDRSTSSTRKTHSHSRREKSGPPRRHSNSKSRSPQRRQRRTSRRPSRSRSRSPPRRRRTRSPARRPERPKGSKKSKDEPSTEKMRRNRSGSPNSKRRRRSSSPQRRKRSAEHRSKSRERGHRKSPPNDLRNDIEAIRNKKRQDDDPVQCLSRSGCIMGLTKSCMACDRLDIYLATEMEVTNGVWIAAARIRKKALLKLSRPQLAIKMFPLENKIMLPNMNPGTVFVPPTWTTVTLDGLLIVTIKAEGIEKPTKITANHVIGYAQVMAENQTPGLLAMQSESARMSLCCGIRVVVPPKTEVQLELEAATTTFLNKYDPCVFIPLDRKSIKCIPIVYEERVVQLTLMNTGSLPVPIPPKCAGYLMTIRALLHSTRNEEVAIRKGLFQSLFERNSINPMDRPFVDFVMDLKTREMMQEQKN